MIGTLEITNFKSIKHLKQECKRINVLIGEPNTGKSNILEALGVVSYCCYHSSAGLNQFVRFERTSNLFYDEDLGEAVGLSFDRVRLRIVFANGNFFGHCDEVAQREERRLVELTGNYDGLMVARAPNLSPLFQFKFYRFAARPDYPRRDVGFLLPPSGQNLMSLLLTHKELRATANGLFSRFGLGLNLRPQENKIEVVKRSEDITISYPYSLASDTLRRVVFHIAAIISNRDSVLIFEEPESHAFPYYTKQLAEMIALDDRQNQYFVSTHNPYFLLPLLEKCPKGEIAITITHYEDYETKTKLLSQEQMEEMTEIDVFSNLDRFLGR